MIQKINNFCRVINFDQLIFCALIILLPIISILVLSLPFLAFSNLDNAGMALLQTLITMVSSFIIIPILVIRQRYDITLAEIGLKKISAINLSIIIGTLLALYLYLINAGKTEDLFFLSFQTFIVAFSEECWARGVLFYMLKKFTNNKIAIILISSLLFAFIIHLNRGGLENLMFRLPGAIIMGVVYSKTENLSYSMLIHFAYNLVIVSAI